MIRYQTSLPRPKALPVIMVINALVWAAWQISMSRPDLQIFLAENFTTSLAHLEAGKWWTLLTSAFSHIETWHLMINMLVLWSFGSIMEMHWGPQRFAQFYVAGGVAASVAHCGISVLGWQDAPALGASGAVAALLVAFVFRYPRQKLLLFFVLPLPAWVAMVAFVGLDIWGLVEQHGGGGLPIGHGAHLGGAVFGALWSLQDMRRRGQPWRRRPDRFDPREGTPWVGDVEPRPPAMRPRDLREMHEPEEWYVHPPEDERSGDRRP